MEKQLCATAFWSCGFGSSLQTYRGSSSLCPCGTAAFWNSGVEVQQLVIQRLCGAAAALWYSSGFVVQRPCGTAALWNSVVVLWLRELSTNLLGFNSVGVQLCSTAACGTAALRDSVFVAWQLGGTA